MELGSQSSLREKLFELTTVFKREANEDIIDLNRMDWSGILKKRIEPIWNLMATHSGQINGLLETVNSFKEEIIRWGDQVEGKLAELVETRDMDEKIELINELEAQFTEFSTQKSQNIAELDQQCQNFRQSEIEVRAQIKTIEINTNNNTNSTNSLDSACWRSIENLSNRLNSLDQNVLNKCSALQRVTEEHNCNFQTQNQVIDQKVGAGMQCVFSKMDEFKSQIITQMGADSDSLMAVLKEKFGQIEQLQKFTNKIADQLDRFETKFLVQKTKKATVKNEVKTSLSPIVRSKFFCIII
jgi:hypothetical protein